ncbi:hypothetical protein CcCBS67573_g07108 [Chytriomyces confervae]|uniref:Mitogen-activated protein kinase n=1 Tax=Chytriomyces confervae TaxID=246404 RepID=A0A507EX63_9FUNG|nr:hypothetical protein CcCBS67573_g07108 [Chytriomyces confervae]
MFDGTPSQTRWDFIADRYEPQYDLGQGAYGVVCAARHKQTGRDVAIKKVVKVFEKSMLAKRALREIKLLRHFHGHQNITGLWDMDISDTVNFNEIYLVQDLMEADLHQIIYSDQSLSDPHLQYFMYQLCRGLKYIHSANVLHRDLKPSNLLVNADCELKICDFGLARGLAGGAEDSGFLTEYVATRWYRAPEIIMVPVTRKSQVYIRSLPKKIKIPWNYLFPHATPEALAFLEELLKFDPSKRMTVEQALAHPYLEAYHNLECEPSHPHAFDFGFESLDSIEDMKGVIAQEVLEYKTRGSLDNTQHSGDTPAKPKESLHGPTRDQIGFVPKDVDTYMGTATNVDDELMNIEGSTQG